MIIGDPREENFHACVIATNFVPGNKKVRGRHTPIYLEIYYTAKRNGQWKPYWSSSYFLEKVFYCPYVESTTPSPHMVSVGIFEPNRCYGYTFETQGWTVSDLVEEKQIEYVYFQEFFFTQLKERLKISPQTPTILDIKGSTTVNRT